MHSLRENQKRITRIPPYFPVFPGDASLLASIPSWWKQGRRRFERSNSGQALGPKEVHECHGRRYMSLRPGRRNVRGHRSLTGGATPEGKGEASNAQRTPDHHGHSIPFPHASLAVTCCPPPRLLPETSPGLPLASWSQKHHNYRASSEPLVGHSS